MPDKPEEQPEQQANGEEQQNGDENGQTEAVRELTQTDRLNKRLLSSFLERMNSNDDLLQRFSSTNNNHPQSSDPSADEFAS